MPQTPDNPIPYATPAPARQRTLAQAIALYLAIFFAVGVGMVILVVLAFVLFHSSTR